MGAEMEHTTDNCGDGAEIGVARSGQANDFATDAVLLGGEGEAGKGGSLKVSRGGGLKVEAFNANKELNVTETERGSFRLCRGVFAGAQEEEEG